jgi:hypothetical protein
MVESEPREIRQKVIWQGERFAFGPRAEGAKTQRQPVGRKCRAWASDSVMANTIFWEPINSPSSSRTRSRTNTAAAYAILPFRSIGPSISVFSDPAVIQGVHKCNCTSLYNSHLTCRSMSSSPNRRFTCMSFRRHRGGRRGLCVCHHCGT